MKLKPIVAAIIGLSAVGVAFAGGNGGKVNTAAQDAVATGNSVWSANPVKLANGRLLLGGAANIDARWSSKTNYTAVPHWLNAEGAGGKSSFISLDTVDMFLGSDLSDWAHARADIAYLNYPVFSGTAAYPSNLNTLTMAEGYVTFSNFAKSPFFAKVGKSYVDFGMYNARPIVPSLTQLFTEASGTGVEGGYAGSNGFDVNASVFSGSKTSTSLVNNRSRVNDFTLKGGYSARNNGVDWNVRASYLNSVEDLAWFNSTDFMATYNGTTATFSQRSSAMSAHAGFNVKAFDVAVDYARFNKDFTNTANSSAAINKPWAGGISAGYAFNTMQYPSHLALGYQMTKKAENMYVPKNRYMVTYDAGINKNVSLQAVFYHDKNYTQSEAQSNNNMVQGRVSVKF